MKEESEYSKQSKEELVALLENSEKRWQALWACWGLGHTIVWKIERFQHYGSGTGLNSKLLSRWCKQFNRASARVMDYSEDEIERFEPADDD